MFIDINLIAYTQYLFFNCKQLCGHDVELSEIEASAQDGSDIAKHGAQPVVNGNSNHVDQSDGSRPHQQPMSLSQEFSLLNKQIPNVSIDKVKKKYIDFCILFFILPFHGNQDSIFVMLNLVVPSVACMT